MHSSLPKSFIAPMLWKMAGRCHAFNDVLLRQQSEVLSRSIECRWGCSQFILNFDSVYASASCCDDAMAVQVFAYLTTQMQIILCKRVVVLCLDGDACYVYIDSNLSTFWQRNISSLILLCVFRSGYNMRVSGAISSQKKYTASASCVKPISHICVNSQYSQASLLLN